MFYTSYVIQICFILIFCDQTMGDELEQKRSERTKLQRELESGPSPSDCDDAALKIRRDKQMKLEVLQDRVTELGELERVKAVKKHAIESGLVVSLYDAVYNRQCAVCLDDPDTSGSQVRAWRSCCGQALCCQCDRAVDKRIAEAHLQLARTTEFFEARQLKAEISTLQRCPYCKARSPREEQLGAQMLSHAQQGNSWAQFCYGNMNEKGVYGVKKDRLEAKRWYTLSANQGCAAAMEFSHQVKKDSNT
jgi:sarcosine oxidase delta subunit